MPKDKKQKVKTHKQKTLVLDYLDGSVKTKPNVKYATCQCFFKACKYINKKIITSDTLVNGIDYSLIDIIDRDVVKGYLDALERDETVIASGMRKNLASMVNYFESPLNVYVFSDYLTDILMNTSISMSCNNLMIATSGYVELDTMRFKVLHGLYLRSFFYTIRQIKNEWVFRFTMFTYEDGGHRVYTDAIFTQSFILKRGKTFEDVLFDFLNKTKPLEFERIDDDEFERNRKEAGDKFSIVVNIITYILNTDDQLPRYNQYVGMYPKGMFTKKPFIYLDHKKVIDYKVTETFVRGHFRWQPYGPNRSKVKLIYIKPTTRHYDKGGNDVKSNNS